MSHIDTNIPTEVLVSVAKECGFSVVRDLDADVWTLSSGHGIDYEHHTGSRSDICAFLAGYTAMRVKAANVLRDADAAIARARERL